MTPKFPAYTAIENTDGTAYAVISTPADSKQVHTESGELSYLLRQLDTGAYWCLSQSEVEKNYTASKYIDALTDQHTPRICSGLVNSGLKVEDVDHEIALFINSSYTTAAQLQRLCIATDQAETAIADLFTAAESLMPHKTYGNNTPDPPVTNAGLMKMITGIVYTYHDFSTGIHTTRKRIEATLKRRKKDQIEAEEAANAPTQETLL